MIARAARTVSLVSLLVACIASPGSHLRLKAQELGITTHALTVGEYHKFNWLSRLRLYSDPIFAPEEAQSADVRCFHELRDLSLGRRHYAVREIRLGRVHLASRIDDTYYVVETETVAVPQELDDPLGVPTTMLASPVDNHLTPILNTTGTIAASQDWDSDRYWVEMNAHAGASALGVVTSGIGELWPCDTKIINWSGAQENVGYAGFVFPDGGPNPPAGGADPRP